MSAFVVDRETMDRALSALFANGVYHDTIFGENPRVGPLSALASRIGRRLWAMNIAAVEGRYPDCVGNDHIPGWDGCRAMVETYVWQGKPAQATLHELMQPYKSLRCLIYQCSEDPVHGSPEFRELERCAGKVAHALVEALPAYDRARWE